MLLLAIDTSGPQGGITLARGSGDEFEVIESAAIQGGTFSAELIPQLSQLLAKQDLTPQRLEGAVAVTGPGSFTGLRVGLAAVKGLAEVLHLPIAAVTSLEVLRAASDCGEAAMAILDAGRGDVYAGLENQGGWEELLLSLAEATELAKAQKLHVVAADRNLASKFGNAELVAYRSSEVAARLGLRKLLAGDTTDVLTLDANYIRKSEAEYLQKLKK